MTHDMDPSLDALTLSWLTGKPIGQQHNLIFMRCFALTIYDWKGACRGWSSMRRIQVRTFPGGLWFIKWTLRSGVRAHCFINQNLIKQCLGFILKVYLCTKAGNGVLKRNSGIYGRLEEFKSVMAWGMKLSLSLVVRARMLQYRRPDGSRQNSLWLGW